MFAEKGEAAEKIAPSRLLRALIITPTRELALQVTNHLNEVAKGTNFRVVPIVGGMSTEKQERLLKARPKIVVGTPGRLWELMSGGELHLIEEMKISTKIEPALTLKEFLDLFIKDENKEVQGIFESYKRDDEDEDEDEDNKIGMTKVLMEKFVSEVDVTMPWENWNSTSKVIEDGKYLILENQVSILKALFSKYKGFINRSILSTKAMVLFIMTVCEAVHNMCSTEVLDITTSLLVTWFDSFALAQYADFEIKFFIARLDIQVAEQLAVVDSKELVIIEQDGETNDLRKKTDSMQLTIIKLDKAIEELEKKKQAFLKTRDDNCIRKECLNNAVELDGQMAGTSLL
ncbi:unnamed protein product [Camellia sinensis]